MIAEQGIVGMIIEDEEGDAIALDIETIRQVITIKWGYPWNLEEFSTAIETTAPREVPSSITVQPTSPSSLTSTPQVAEDNNVRFELLGCEMAGTTLTCRLIIKSEQDVEDFTLFGTGTDELAKSRIVDEFGNEDIAERVVVGSHSGTQGATVPLSGRIPVQASVHFENVSPLPKKLAGLIIWGFANANLLKVSFPDVSVSVPSSDITALPASPLRSPWILQIAEASNVRFELLGCERARTTLTCRLIIKSEQDVEDFTLFGAGTDELAKSRIVDEFGNEDIAERVVVGSHSGTQEMGVPLSAGIPKKASIHFENVSLQTKRLSGLILFGFANANVLEASFQDIPIAQ